MLPLAARVRFVLVAPSHPGNIGAAARALKTMGFTQLHVVAPREPGFADHADAVAFATHGADLLTTAQVHATLADALTGVSLAFAMTGYAREFGAQVLDLRAAAAQAHVELAAQPGAQIAFVFGGERNGLSNADVGRCQRCCAIPADPQSGSLNLAQAVMVCAYECRLALTGGAVDAGMLPFDDEPPASVDRLEGFYEHLERALVAAGFLHPTEPRRLMSRLRRLFARARPTPTEVDILRGIAAALEQPKRERIGSRKAGTASSPDAD
jgi:tRNA/rRNA methyltransferase